MTATKNVLRRSLSVICTCLVLVCVLSRLNVRVICGQDAPNEKRTELRSFFGIVQPFRKVTLSARFDDLIPVMNVEEGDEVSKGDVIAQQEFIIRGLIVKRLENLANDRTAIESNEVTADILEKSYNRSQFLVKTDEESEQDLEQRELDWKRAKISVDAAKRDLERFALNLEAQKHDFEYTKIVTPISGIVVKKYHEVGETVDQQTRKMVDIINIENVLVEVAEIPAEMLTKVVLDDDVKVRIPALGGREFDGKIYRISPIVDPTSQRFKVKVIVKNPWQPCKASERREIQQQEQHTRRSDDASSAAPKESPKEAKDKAADVDEYLDTSGMETPRPPRRKRDFLIKPGLTAEVIFTIK